MYPVPKNRENQHVTHQKAARLEHHPVFRQFSCWKGPVPEGFIVNFLGTLTRVNYFESFSEVSKGYPEDRHVTTDYPPFDEEYFEWIDVLESVMAARGDFTMLELGAGYGRWTANAAAALKHVGKPAYTLIAVEAEPTHFSWLVQHLADNSVDSKNVRLVQAAVAEADGTVGFYAGETKFGGPANWYGQRIGGSHFVDAVTLTALLQPLGSVDLIDVDVQGSEVEILEAAADELDRKVKRVHIGTHSSLIEEGLHRLFGRLGWKCVRSFPCGETVETEWGSIPFGDGVQTWLNPEQLNPRGDYLTVLRQKLEAARQESVSLWTEVQRTREERDRERGSLATVERSIGWRLVLRLRRLRDRVAPAGTRRRALFDLIAKGSLRRS